MATSKNTEPATDDEVVCVNAFCSQIRLNGHRSNKFVTSAVLLLFVMAGAGEKGGRGVV